MARTLPQWREPREVVRLAQLAVAERDGTARQQILESLGTLDSDQRIVFLDMPRIDVSSSLVRERLAAGLPIEDLVPPAVAEYVAQHGLYRDPAEKSADPGEELMTVGSRVVRCEDEVMQPDELARAVSAYAADKKAHDIVELDLRAVLGYTDYFVICTGNSDRQVKAIHDGIHQGLKKEHGLIPRRVEGASQARWILMDYLDVIVHVFTAEAREFYRLEQLWGEAPAREVVVEGV